VQNPIYLETTVFDPITSCESTPVFDTIMMFNPTASFDLDSRSYLIGDTLQIYSYHVKENRIWSSSTLASNLILNLSDTVPIIIPDNVGFHNIELKNEPIVGCVDSMMKKIHITNPAADFEPTCAIGNSLWSKRIHKIKVDQFGNRYELGSKSNTYQTASYTLRKYSNSGNLIWKKEGLFIALPDVNGAVIENIAFDADGDLICSSWIEGNVSHFDTYFSFTPIGFERWLMVLKINKLDGSLIWSRRIDDYSNNPALASNSCITDLIVDPNTHQIHLSFYKGTSSSYSPFYFITLDEFGNEINISSFADFTQQSELDIRASFHVMYSDPSFWSPKLKLLSTGEVIAIGHYVDDGAVVLPELSLGDAYYGMFVMKYHPNQGIYDIDKIAQTHFYNVYDPQTQDTPPLVTVDESDNITVATRIKRSDVPKNVEILDSTLVINSGLLLFNFDSDYNLNWLTVGSHGLERGLEYVPKQASIF
jgi:hypothetical protein